jgi:hypothetical protein
MTEAEAKPVPPYRREIAGFVNQIHSLGDVSPLMGGVLQAVRDQIARQFSKETEAYRVSSEDGKTSFQFPDGTAALIRGQFKALSHAREGFALRTRALVVTLVSTYDAYLSRLIRLMFMTRPDLLKASEKTFTLRDVLAIGSLEALQEGVIEREVEAVLRESHVKQFEWLEKKLEIPLRKELPAWTRFVELTERRNLFVHNGGRVNTQYLTVCEREKVQLQEGVKSGTELGAGQEYFENAVDVITEIGVKLGQVMWRKLSPDEVSDADGALIAVILDELRLNHFSLAERLIEFRESIPRGKHERSHVDLLFKLNHAQTLRWKGDVAGCNDVLAGIDFEPLSHKFRLARAVLSSEFERAAEIMPLVGTDSKEGVARDDYLEWPIFREFRQTESFAVAFEKLFGEPPNVFDMNGIMDFMKTYADAEGRFMLGGEE